MSNVDNVTINHYAEQFGKQLIKNDDAAAKIIMQQFIALLTSSDPENKTNNCAASFNAFEARLRTDITASYLSYHRGPNGFDAISNVFKSNDHIWHEKSQSKRYIPGLPGAAMHLLGYAVLSTTILFLVGLVSPLVPIIIFTCLIAMGALYEAAIHNIIVPIKLKKALHTREHVHKQLSHAKTTSAGTPYIEEPAVTQLPMPKEGNQTTITADMLYKAHEPGVTTAGTALNEVVANDRNDTDVEFEMTLLLGA
jgi:hypothetical protein